MIQSPCIRLCTLNDKDQCVGCKRTLEEIKQWRSFSEKERSKIMIELGERKL